MTQTYIWTKRFGRGYATSESTDYTSDSRVPDLRLVCVYPERIKLNYWSSKSRTTKLREVTAIRGGSYVWSFHVGKLTILRVKLTAWNSMYRCNRWGLTLRREIGLKFKIEQVFFFTSVNFDLPTWRTILKIRTKRECAMVCNVWYAVYFLVWIIKDGFASPDLNKCKCVKEFKTDCFFFQHEKNQHKFRIWSNAKFRRLPSVRS